jgi:hypothetical protein
VRHAIHPEADAEFAEAARYYAEIAPELGARFYLEMERLIRDVCAHPERFRMFGCLPSMFAFFATKTIRAHSC